MMIRHLLLIGIDGLRVDRAFGTGLAPTLDALALAGSFQQATVEGATVSGPSWSSILAAQTLEEHGVFDNTFANNRLRKDGDLLARASLADSTTRTLAVSSWPGIAHPEGPGPIIATRAEMIDAGLHVNIVVDGAECGDDPDTEVLRRTLIEFDERTPDVAFVYLWLTDHVGHEFGGISPEYDEAIRVTDERIDRLVGSVKRRVEQHEEEWIVAITTDHGHRDEGGHGGDSDLERRTFLLVETFGTEKVEVPEDIRPVEFSTLLLGARRLT